MNEEQVIIFSFPNLTEQASFEVQRQLKKVLAKYGIEPVVTNKTLHTISKEELRTFLEDMTK